MARPKTTQETVGQAIGTERWQVVGQDARVPELVTNMFLGLSNGNPHGSRTALIPRWEGITMIALGVILLIIGLVAQLPILWTLGVIALVIGAILAIAGSLGHALGGRKHWF